MIYSFTRIASLVLAFGFFISCSTTSSNINPKNDTQSLSETELEKQIDALNQEIAAGDSSANILYKKGLYLTRLAQKKEQPSDRTILYTDASRSLHESADQSSSLDGTTNEDQARQLLNVAWSNEHNQGVKIMQSDSTLDNSKYRHAAAHFENATAINPDSAISYTIGARAYYNSQQPQKAISMLEEAHQKIENPPTVLFEQLAFLYLENNHPQKAIKTYEKAESFSKQNLNLIHGLSNAYMSAGEHQKAVQLLQSLVDQKPENIIYHQSLATELYHWASQKIDSLVSSTNKNSTTIVETYLSADSLLNRAEGHLSELVEQNPANKEIKERLGQFYHNSASKYQQVMPLVDKYYKTKIESRIEHFLTSSLPLYQELAKQNPEQTDYWQNLYQAYSYLGMEEEARKVKSNF